MAYDIGPKIGIEGEAEFRKQIGQITTELRTLGTEMNVVSSAYDKNDRSSVKLSAQNRILTEQIAKQKEKVAELQAMLKKSAEKYGDLDERTLKWKQAVNNAQAQLNRMNVTLEQNKEALARSGKAAGASGEKFQKLGSVVKASGAIIASACAAAGIAAVKLASEVTRQYGELEQNIGGSVAVFGQYAEQIQKTGEEAYKNLGVSQSDYLATANKMGALFQGSGIDQRRSLELTEKAMQRAADTASVMGIDMQMALDSIAGAAKGNFTMMDNLGVAMNATNIEAYAAAKGIKFVWNQASQAEKAELAMQMFFERTEQYAGNFARESMTTVTGSLGLFHAALNSFTAGLGNADADMERLTSNLAEAFQAVVNNITPVIDNLVAAMPTAFEAIASAMGAILPNLLETVSRLFGEVLDALLKSLPELIPAVVSSVILIANTLVDNIDLIVDGAFELVIALAEGIVEALPELVPKVVLAVEKIVNTINENMPLVIGAAGDIMVALAAGLIKSLPELAKTVPIMLETLWESFKAMKNQTNRLGEEIAKGILEGIFNAKNLIKKKLKSWKKDVIAYFEEAFEIHSPSRVMRDEVGKPIGEGVAAGIDQSLVTVVHSAKTVSDALLGEEERLQGELDKLKKQTAKTNEEILEDSLSAQLKLVQDFKQEYDAAIAEVEKSKTNMSDTLLNFGGLFERTQNALGKELFELTDLQEQIDLINRYGDSLEKLKERGISESLLDEIVGMGVDDALDYAGKLLSMSAEQYEEYMALWEEKRLAARDVAERFYQGELEELESEFVDRLPESLSSLKDEMRGIGVNAGRGLAAGFKSQSSHIQKTFTSVLDSAMRAAKASLEIHSPSKKWAEVGKFMALGLGEGFTSEMQGVSQKINGSIPTDAGFSKRYQTAAKMGEGIVNGLAGIMPERMSGSPIVIKLVTPSGKVLAEEVYNPLQDIARQKGSLIYG